MPATVPLRRMVLYKHGVGYFTRQGTATDREVELSFRSTEVDDALKSLTVFTLNGGHVLGVHYPTPQDKDERFAEIPIDLTGDHSFFDLIRSLRGAQVALHLRSGDEIQGRIVGMELHPQTREFGATLALVSEPGTVEQVPTEQIERMRIGEERPAHDLDYYLDTSMSEESRRTVTVALDEAGRAVQISYTAPSPVWRVSYRFVGSEQGGDDPGTRVRVSLLQGWGIFDNRLDEDLEDIEVTLVAGQPVSFRYDLTSSVIPERALVRDEARIAAGPVEFAGALLSTTAALEQPEYPAPPVAAAPSPAGAVPVSFARREPSRQFESLAAMDTDVLAGSTTASAEGQELDELFEYRVGGVSVKRGESAMVPIVQHTGRYRRELLYNGGKFPRHPVVTTRLQNTTGLTLERGPVTVIEDGRYRGEAILPFTKRDAEIALAFAVELGIRVNETVSRTRTVVGLEIQGKYLHIQEYQDTQTAYELVNSTPDEQVVTVEQAKTAESDLVDTRPPDEETGEHRRWRVACPPSSRTEVQITERRELSRYEAVMDQQLVALSNYLEELALDGATREKLQEILRLRQAVTDVDQRMGKLRSEQKALVERQAGLRQNLEIKATSKLEEEIRRRSAEEFRRTQDREDEINQELQRLAEERQTAEAALQTALEEL